MPSRWISLVPSPILASAESRQLLWLLDPANRLIVDANAASTDLLFQHLLMPADSSNQFSMLALPLTRAAGNTVRRSLWIGQTDAVGKRCSPVSNKATRPDAGAPQRGDQQFGQVVAGLHHWQARQRGQGKRGALHGGLRPLQEGSSCGDTGDLGSIFRCTQLMAVIRF